ASRGVRRGIGGEPVWLVVGVVAWLVRRARRRTPAPEWSGRLDPGQGLIITTMERRPAGNPPPATG
ncbi:MAG: hypothetical protein ACYDD6_11325, partial [Acidimicrobiales bacterium]